MSFRFALRDSDIAKQVAQLLNDHNKLGRPRRMEDILHSSVSYLLEIQGRVVVGACGVDRQSYTFTEIKHLVVHPKFRRKGVARFLVNRAVDIADTPLIYASVRSDNQSSLELFKGLNFNPSVDYKSTDHQVSILTRINEQWQKSLSGYTSSLRKDQPVLFSGAVGLPSE